VQRLQAPKGSTALRTPQTILKKTADDDAVTFENYDDTDYGYLRLIVDPQQLRIEYHPASDALNSKTPDDSVTIDLKTRKRTSYTPNDLGFTKDAEHVHQQRMAQNVRPRWKRKE